MTTATISSPQSSSTTTTTTKNESHSPFLIIHNVPIYFTEDWQSGRIGGGLWSTGWALARYLSTESAVQNLAHITNQIVEDTNNNNNNNNSSLSSTGMSVLELGSGNGFLAMCVAAIATAHPTRVHIQNLVVTDVFDHLNQIQQTIDRNKIAMCGVGKVAVLEHTWGCFPLVEDKLDPNPVKFDLIFGSDVAYRQELYDPLIQSLRYFSHAKTVSLIGVTMEDTTPEFFDRLIRDGFVYQKFADHLIEKEYRGKTFAIIAIRMR